MAQSALAAFNRTAAKRNRRGPQPTNRVADNDPAGRPLADTASDDVPTKAGRRRLGAIFPELDIHGRRARRVPISKPKMSLRREALRTWSHSASPPTSPPRPRKGERFQSDCIPTTTARRATLPLDAEVSGAGRALCCGAAIVGFEKDGERPGRRRHYRSRKSPPAPTSPS